MKLIKLQYNFILTKKVKVISSLLISLTWIVLLLQSELLDKGSNLIYNRELIVTSLLYDGFNIIKIISVLYSMLLTVYVFYLNSYDVFIVTRKSRIKVILSKVVTLLGLEVLFVMYLFLMYVIIWGLLDYNITILDVLPYLGYLLILSCYFTLMNIILIVVFSSIFIVIIPFGGYLLSNLSIDYGISVNEIEESSKLLNLFFPEVFIYHKEVFFVYSPLIVLDISILFLVLIIIKYKVDDIII